MKILFSPSETKSDLQDANAINQSSFFAPELFDVRESMIKTYLQFINGLDSESLMQFFGLKDAKACKEFQSYNLLTAPTCKAIQRYTGVAFDHLSYTTLNNEAQKWIDDNVLIFSNLFGPMLAKDNIPVYRYKQGAQMGEIKPEKYYKDHFKDAIDTLLKGELIIDLRAGFYEKFYTLPYPSISMKFIKNGKVVSHWAKAYRGKILRILAQNRPENFENFESIAFEGLVIKEILKKGKISEFIFDIKQ